MSKGGKGADDIIFFHISNILKLLGKGNLGCSSHRKAVFDQGGKQTVRPVKLVPFSPGKKRLAE
ncbi:hypothetical protein [Ralstonia solanacearum]|uniref:hypothetical protein n=1 Tax=Ralstonia solanacearum TaxID=305 RepID=UPI0018B01176|nr:hypothetical protein [Ralstonia solanacearum]